MKETFILRTEWFDTISKLSESEQSAFLRSIFFYHLGQADKIELPTLSMQLIWSLIEPNLRRNIEHYDRRRETSAENGKKGGRPTQRVKPKKPKSKPNKPIETLSDTVSDTDTDTDTVSDTEKKKIIKYRDNIRLTKVENDKLVAEHGELITSACYDYLSEYKIEKRYKTDSDYLTIRRWVVDAVKKKGATPALQVVKMTDYQNKYQEELKKAANWAPTKKDEW